MDERTHPSPIPSNVTVYDSPRELEIAAAEAMLSVMADALRTRGLCHVALAGGTTPRSVYRLVGNAANDGRIDWDRVHLYFGDERMVPPADPESNYRMVCDELISRIAMPAENIHRIRGEMAAVDAAALYEIELSAKFHTAAPSFDLTLLGLGTDGHTASLFPGTDAVGERERSVRGVFVPSSGTWRTTLTVPVINRSREIIFLVSGKSKASIVRSVVRASEPDAELPASLIRPESGRLRWMLDRDAAASILPQS